MVRSLDGSLERVMHVWSETGNLIFHDLHLDQTFKLKPFPVLFMLAQHILSYLC